MAEGLDLQAWWESGARTSFEVSSLGEVSLFTRTQGEGAGPWTTFWHGFPTSSWDWAPVAAHLGEDRPRLFLDHLGFGASDKPATWRHSFQDQLALCLGAWAHHGVEETLLVCHDYSVTLAQEVLARMDEGRWTGPEITAVLLLNGGLFYSAIQPRPIQRLLRSRITGPLVSRLITQGSFERAMQRIVSDEHPFTRDELAQHWQAIERSGGRRLAHRLARYQDEREAHEARWTRALARAKVPVVLLWGLQDPVSGPAILDHATDVAPYLEVHAWEAVGHYPHLEAPGSVADLVQRVEAGDLEQFAAPDGS
ncbi:MAG: alpha/beta hydrolase [Candidatus Thermoplasmatota archaeon]|nr:alpha/beta hydrolase [Candidatus Thermoplasmatota archaeon]